MNSRTSDLARIQQLLKLQAFDAERQRRRSPFLTMFPDTGPFRREVQGVFPGPVDTDMTRDLELPKASPESVALAIFDGLENGDEDIFPDSMSQSLAEAWRTGAVKALERQFTALVPQGATN